MASALSCPDCTFESALSPPNALVHCESYATALALVARSDLLALVLGQMLEGPITEPFLQRIRTREKVSRPTIGIFSRAGAPLSPTAAAMVQSFSAAARAFSRVQPSSAGEGIPRR